MAFDLLAQLASELVLDVQARRRRWVNRLVYGSIVALVLLAIAVGAFGS